MPIYEYVCRECGHELEQLQRLSDQALTDCPACSQSALKRKISAAGFRLSGGGWYETDFKSDGRRNVASNEKSESGSQDSGKDSKTGEGAKSGTDAPNKGEGAAKTGDSSAKTATKSEHKSSGAPSSRSASGTDR